MNNNTTDDTVAFDVDDKSFKPGLGEYDKSKSAR
jgi:hypothetical protein